MCKFPSLAGVCGDWLFFTDNPGEGLTVLSKGRAEAGPGLTVDCYRCALDDWG